ncbi:MAG: SRPBCC family protein [Acidobacteriia bacterium]|nr:SRPBCC family protein [Terriglobia bacterium]
MLPRFDYSVSVPVSVDAAFHAFQDLDRLLHRGIYEEASFVEGQPWHVGSRLRYVVIKPVKATITAVVNSLSAPRAITLLNHALGITAEQQVTFGPDLEGGTRVRMTLVCVGEPTELPENVIQEAVTFLVKDALDTVVALCNRLQGSSPTGR